MSDRKYNYVRNFIRKKNSPRYKYFQFSSTDNRSQFITPSVNVCAQHDGMTQLVARVRLRQLRLAVFIY